MPITVRAVGKNAIGCCEHEDCAALVELTRQHSCGGGPGGGQFGCGSYLCAEHLDWLAEVPRRGLPGHDLRVRNIPLCKHCFDELDEDPEVARTKTFQGFEQSELEGVVFGNMED